VTRILLVGGYGAFGRRAAQRLGRFPDLELVIAGRSREAAERAAGQLSHVLGRPVQSGVIDAMRATALELRALRPSVVLNLSGPFQEQTQYALARAAITAGCHYIDIADARAHVSGIGVLDREATAAGVAVIAGASTVPAVTAAIADAARARMGAFDTLSCALVPGNRYDPGPATTRSVLAMAGRPFSTLRRGRMVTVYGWSDRIRFSVPGAGARYASRCDVPDLDLFPRRYPGLLTQDFRAGVEVKLFHLGLSALAALTKRGTVAAPEAFAPVLLRAKRALWFIGSNVGAMQMRFVNGEKEQIFDLVAGSDDGPSIPVTPATLLARRLARREIAVTGARACLDLMTLDEFTADVADLDIKTTWR
jgi:saccharopine dehydrogenase-like NADP-dependent oxidoreductase